MKRVSLLPLPFLLIATCGIARGQTAREQGERLREELAKAPPRALGTTRLSVHLGTARVGDLSLTTTVEEKGGEKLYHLRDELRFDAPGFGAVYLELEADVAADLSVRDLALNVTKPGVKGGTERRRLAVAPEGDALFLTEAVDEEPAKKTKLEGLDRRALVLTPPLGVGERLARLAKGDVGTRLSLDGWDLARGEKATLALSFDEVAPHDVRGSSVSAQKVTRGEGAAHLEEWLVPDTRELLRIERADGPGRLVFVGREGEKLEDLPSPGSEKRAQEGPDETVLRFLRASGRGDKAEVESLLDVDRILERTMARAGAKADEKFAKTFRKTLVSVLTDPEWRRGDGVRLIAGATRKDDLEVATQGEHATVKARGATTAFELEHTAAGWRIVALPEKP